MKKKTERIKKYERNYLGDYDFERTMVWARQKYILSLIDKFKPEVVVEIGCGSDLLFNKVESYPELKRWIIIEPAQAFVTQAKKIEAIDTRVLVIEGFVEDVIRNQNLPKADLCICSGLLHEIENPQEVLEAAVSMLNVNGLLHVNVPNACSFHRQLAVEMGLINDVHNKSSRNKALSQFHVFDLSSLVIEMGKVDLHVVEKGGYLIKPFTHQQMEKTIGAIGKEVIDGLWRLGGKYPELASEVYINASR